MTNLKIKKRNRKSENQVELRVGPGDLRIRLTQKVEFVGRCIRLHGKFKKFLNELISCKHSFLYTNI